MTDFLTTKRYKCATVYVNQYSRLGYVYLQKTASAEETVEGKKAFEAFARQHGVQILNYHADNGIFKAHPLWMEECKRMLQGMAFAGVNAHHQNGIAERRIRELQELARAMLIHAASRWADSVTANLWPYAIRHACEAINNTPSFQNDQRKRPIELFTGSKVADNPKHWKHLHCQYIFWTMISKVRDRSINGSTGQGRAYDTSESRPNTPETWRWCWTGIVHW